MTEQDKELLLVAYLMDRPDAAGCKVFYLTRSGPDVRHNGNCRDLGA